MSIEEAISQNVRQAVEEAVAPLVQELRELRKQLEAAQQKPTPLEDDAPVNMGEAAALLKCSKVSVSKYMLAGDLKFFIPPGGKQKKTRRSWIEEFIQKRAAM